MSTMVKLDSKDYVGTGRYEFPELPAEHYWELERGFGFSFARLSIMKPGFLFARTVASKSMAFFYAETKDGVLRPYEPGNRIFQTAMRLRYDTFPQQYPDAREPDYYLDHMRKGAGTEEILESVYHQNFGKHTPGDDIQHYDY